jgi:hypothetical protein
MYKVLIIAASTLVVAAAQAPAEAASFGGKVFTAAAPRGTALGGRVMLIPQPLPPKVLSYSAPGSRVMLNPQPLPPKVFTGVRIR